MFRGAALGPRPGGRALRAPVAGLTDSDRRLAAQRWREGGKRLVVDPRGSGEQPWIGGEIFLGPHVEQERCACVPMMPVSLSTEMGRGAGMCVPPSPGLNRNAIFGWRLVGSTRIPMGSGTGSTLRLSRVPEVRLAALVQRQDEAALPVPTTREAIVTAPEVASARSTVPWPIAGQRGAAPVRNMSSCREAGLQRQLETPCQQQHGQTTSQATVREVSASDESADAASRRDRRKPRGQRCGTLIPIA